MSKSGKPQETMSEISKRGLDLLVEPSEKELRLRNMVNKCCENGLFILEINNKTRNYFSSIVYNCEEKLEKRFIRYQNQIAKTVINSDFFGNNNIAIN